MRPTTTALTAVGRMLVAARDNVHREWADWILKRLSTIEHFSGNTVERQLGMLLDVLIMLVGPLRRETNELWLNASEWYGRTAAQRGLAAGEIVEEFQYLREVLIRHLSQLIGSLTARQSMASVLRLNRHLDTGISHAVVGYTDTLVESLLERQGIPLGAVDAEESEIEERLEQFEEDVKRLRERIQRAEVGGT